MTVAELRKRFDEVGAQIRSKLDEAENGVVTEDVQEKIDALVAEREGIKRNIQLRAEMEESTRGLPTVPAPMDAQPPKADPEVRGGKDREAERPFADVGDQLRSIALAAAPGGTIDKRLLRVHDEYRAATGLSEAVPADGGFLVDQPLAAGILQRMFDGGEILSRVTRLPLGANSNGIRLNKLKENSRADGSRWGGVQGYWLPEAGALTASQPEFEQSQLRLNKVGALVYATQELLDDTSALSALINASVPAELRFKVEDAILNGNGVAKPLGFTQVDAYVSVAKESGQTAATVVAENIAKMWARFLGDRNSAAWLVDASVLSQIPTMKIGDTPVWQPNFQVGPNGALFGRPIVVTEFQSVLGQVGDIILADLGQYAFIDKGMQGAVSMHVRFLYDEQAFRFTYRVDGQPMRDQPLTPKSGGDTRSPFVTLAIRS